MRIRGASGLGDTVYIYPVAKHYAGRGDVVVLTKYPEIFRDLDVKTAPFDRKADVDIDCNYCSRKNVPGTSQFKDTLMLAGIGEDLPFEIGGAWEAPAPAVAIKRAGSRICLVKSAYVPMNLRESNVGDMMPDYEKMQALIDRFKDGYKTVLVGQGRQPHRFRNIYLDMQDRTTVPELLGLTAISDMIITQQGFMTAFAEALDRRVLVLFSRRGLESGNPFFSSITPGKVCTKPTTFWCVDSDRKLKARNSAGEPMDAS